MTNSIIILFFLIVTYFVWYAMCPSTSERERTQILAKFSRVVVQNYESGVIHVYKNAGIYSIKRPCYVRTVAPYLSWYTIRARKSSNENFRTLLDLCGLEVELLLFTGNTVKMIARGTHEYTLIFERPFQAESFSDVIYHTALERKDRNRSISIDEIIVRSNNDEEDKTLDAPSSLSHRQISAGLVVFYVKSNNRIIQLIFSTKHFSLDAVTSAQELSLILMIVRGVPLDYSYAFTFYESEDMSKFLAVATDHEFRSSPDAEPQDTGDSDEEMLEDCDFYDPDEIAYFERMENDLSWDV